MKYIISNLLIDLLGYRLNNWFIFNSLNYLTGIESNDRLQVHLKERMSALEEKNHLTQDLDKARKCAEDVLKEKVKLKLIYFDRLGS